MKKTISLVRTRIYPSFELFYFKVYSCLSISKIIKTGDKSYLSCLLHVPYRNAYALYLEGCPIIYYTYIISLNGILVKLYSDRDPDLSPSSSLLHACLGANTLNQWQHAILCTPPPEKKWSSIKSFRKGKKNKLKSY